MNRNTRAPKEAKRYELSQYAFVAAFAATGLAIVLYLVNVVGARGLRALSLAGGGGSVSSSSWDPAFDASGRYATILTVNAFVFLTASLVFRAIASGHGPFSNMYEFSLAFAWGSLAIYIYFEIRYQLRILALMVLPVALGLLAYATTVPSDITPLVPALQNDLLTVHVAVAIVAYGAFTVAFGAAVLFLIQHRDSVRWLPKKAILDEIGYKAVMVGFPMMALVIILGALWADIAWGTYWSWDPKETASLVTWLIYGGYLHARVLRGWRGQRSAVLLILGFAATLFTYYGNLFFGGLHGYA
jgi:cytochrome c-type biogenesis protein CcsB